MGVVAHRLPNEQLIAALARSDQLRHGLCSLGGPRTPDFKSHLPAHLPLLLSWALPCRRPGDRTASLWTRRAYLTGSSLPCRLASAQPAARHVSSLQGLLSRQPVSGLRCDLRALDERAHAGTAVRADP